jgi:hypothetical protein
MRKFSQFVTAVGAVATFAVAAPVQAQYDEQLVAHVPFAFTVGKSRLPGDTYQLTRMNGHREMIVLRGERGGVLVRANEESLPRSNREPSLVFHKYGDQYFLRQIQWESTARLDLPETKEERKAAETRISRAASGMETVTVSAEQK